MCDDADSRVFEAPRYSGQRLHREDALPLASATKRKCPIRKCAGRFHDGCRYRERGLRGGQAAPFGGRSEGGFRRAITQSRFDPTPPKDRRALGRRLNAGLPPASVETYGGIEVTVSR